MSDIDDIKNHLDIVDFIGKRVALKKAGRNFKGLCPFHSEKTPSFMVSPDRQAFHCFGCGKGGSIFDFVMEYDHVDFREALEDLADLAGIKLTKYVPATPQETYKEKLLEIHHVASEYYRYLLTSHTVGEKAREYIKNRGVSEKTQKTFGIGYSANSWDGVTNYLKKKGYDLQILEDSGLVIPSQRGGYDRFRGRLMFPLRDHRGQTVGFSGRLLDPEVKEAKYINSPETQIYKKGKMLFALDIAKGSIQKEQTALLMEGEFDVISSFQEGIGNAVAIKGSALTEDQVLLLKRFASKIIFALDSDIAGDAASRRGIEIAEKAGLEIHVTLMPMGKDPDEVARKEPQALKKAIKDAVSIYDYYLSSALKRIDIQTAYGKKHLSDELLPILSTVENPIIQAHYVKRLADLLSIPEQAIVDMMRKVKRKVIVQTSLPQAITEPISQEDRLDMYVLALLLQGEPPVLLKQIILDDILPAFHSQIVRDVVSDVAQHVQESDFSLSTYIAHVPQEWGNILDTAMTWDIGDTAENTEQYTLEWRSVVRELKKRYLRERIQKVTDSLRNAEEDKQTEFASELTKLAVELRHLEKPAKV